MSKGGGGTQTTIQKQELPPHIVEASKANIAKADEIAKREWTGWQKPVTAAWAPEMNQAVDMTQAGLGSYKPLMTDATQSVDQSGATLGTSRESLAGATGTLKTATGAMDTAMGTYKDATGAIQEGQGTLRSALPTLDTAAGAATGSLAAQGGIAAGERPDIEGFMNPRMSAITDEINRQGSIQRNLINRQAAGRRQLGSESQALLEGQQMAGQTRSAALAGAESWDKAAALAQAQQNIRLQAASGMTANAGALTGVAAGQTGVGQAQTAAGQALTNVGQAQTATGQGYTNIAAGQTGVANAYTANASQETNNAQTQANMANLTQQMQYKDIAALMGIGEAKTADAQANLTQEMANFYEKRDWDKSNLAMQNATLSGVPYEKTVTTTGPGAPGKNVAAGILGGAASGAGAGMMIGGPWGAAAGAVAGGILGAV